MCNQIVIAVIGWSCIPVTRVGLYSRHNIILFASCSDGEIARYTGDEWVCSDDTDTTLNGDEIWDVVSSDFEDIRYNITDIRNKIDGLDMSVFVTNDKHDALAEDVHNLFDSYTEEIANLSNDINNLGIGISSLKKDIDDIWDVVDSMEKTVPNFQRSG